MNHSQRDAELQTFFNQHSQRVRSFARAHPLHTLVEIDIEASDAGAKLAHGVRHVFNIWEACWGKHNSARPSLSSSHAPSSLPPPRQRSGKGVPVAERAAERAAAPAAAEPAWSRA